MEKIQERALRFVTEDYDSPISDILVQTKSKLLHVSRQPQVNTTRYGIKSFLYEATRIWNSLPNDIRQADSYKSFRRLLQTWDGSLAAALFVPKPSLLPVYFAIHLII